MCLPKRTVHMNGLLFTVQYRGNGSTKRSVCEGTVRANCPSWHAMSAVHPLCAAIRDTFLSQQIYCVPICTNVICEGKEGFIWYEQGHIQILCLCAKSPLHRTI